MTTKFNNDWSIGAIVAAGMSTLSVLTTLGSVVWFAAKLSYSVSVIPPMQSQVGANTRDIAVLQDKQTYSDSRYQEILSQLATINVKLDNQQKDLYNAGVTRNNPSK